MIPQYQTLLEHHPMKEATLVTKASSNWAAKSDSKIEPDFMATSNEEKNALSWLTFIQMVSLDILVVEVHLIDGKGKKVLKERPLLSSSESNGC